LLVLLERSFGGAGVGTRDTIVTTRCCKNYNNNENDEKETGKSGESYSLMFFEKSA